MPYNTGMSTRELINLELARMPEALQQEVYDFTRFLLMKSAGDHFNGMTASEAVLAREWDTAEEDQAWANL
jgi:hypothetical protein